MHKLSLTALLVLAACDGGSSDDGTDGTTGETGTGTTTTTTTTDTMTYTADWAGMEAFFADHCEVCHVAGGAGGFDLSAAVSAGQYIVPGDAAASDLWLVLSGGAFPAMPPSGQLPAADIAHVEAWINAGAPL